MPKVRRLKKKKTTKKRTPHQNPTTPLHASSQRAKEKSCAVEGTENVFARLEMMMMKSFLKGNIGFNSELRDFAYR